MAVDGDTSRRKTTKQPDTENQYESQLTADVQGHTTYTVTVLTNRTDGNRKKKDKKKKTSSRNIKDRTYLPPKVNLSNIS